MLAKKITYTIIVLFSTMTIGETKGIPSQLWGKWRVRREIPTETITCWVEKEARAMIGTQIEYTSDSLRWEKVIADHVDADVSVKSAQQFRNEYSGSGSNVTFEQLGIQATKVTQISINHPDGNIASGTTEIPGDVVLVKDQNTVIFSMCNVYFEAKRIEARKIPQE